MRYFLSFTLILVGFSICIRAQTAPQTSSTPDPTLMREIEWRSVKSHLDRLDTLQKITSPDNRPAEDNKRIILDALYRRSTATELPLRFASDEFPARYSTFLKQPGT